MYVHAEVILNCIAFRTEPIKTPQSKALTFDGQLPSADASKASNKLSNLECRQPSEDNIKHLDKFSVDSISESDSEGHK